MSNKKCSICRESGHEKSFHNPIPTEKICLICSEKLPASEFYLMKYGKRPRLHSYCKKCDIKKSHKQYVGSIKGRLKRLWLSIKHRTIKKKQVFEITEQDLLEQYNKQNGLCFYTGDKLSLDTGKESISIDRLDSDFGYTKNNVVFTSWRINHMKNNDSHNKFLEICSKISKYEPIRSN